VDRLAGLPADVAADPMPLPCRPAPRVPLPLPDPVAVAAAVRVRARAVIMMRWGFDGGNDASFSVPDERVAG
jgi:hypothetical protein